MKTYNNSRIKFSQRLLQTSIMAITVFLFTIIAGCNDSTTEPGTSGKISMTTQYSSTDSPPNAFPKIVQTTSAAGSMSIDSLRITRARFVLRDIKFKTQSDSSSFRATPFVLELNLTSVVQDMSVQNVPFGTYHKIEFDVHRIETNDMNSLSASDQVQFQDFLAGDRYSIIVSGSFYTAGQSVSFTFKSRVSAKQKIDMKPEMVVSEPTPAVNATMLISSGGWFKTSGGLYLDPTDILNENTISDNMRASIKVFKDNNKDGSKDAN